MSVATIGAVGLTDTDLIIPGVPQIPYALLLTGAGSTTEVIEVRSLQRGGHVYVTRGAFGSLPVAHTAPVVVTLYDPNSGGGGGGGGVTGDNGVDEPSAVDTIGAAGAVIADGRMQIYPAAVNVSTTGSDDNDLSVGAVSFNGYASASRSASAAGTGYAFAGAAATTTSGNADATTTAQVGGGAGVADASVTATTSGSGAAQLFLIAGTAENGGEARTGLIAQRFLTEASLRVRVDTSGVVHFLLTGCPTADPHVAGELWNSSGTLKVSAG